MFLAGGGEWGGSFFWDAGILWFAGGCWRGFLSVYLKCLIIRLSILSGTLGFTGYIGIFVVCRPFEIRNAHLS